MNLGELAGWIWEATWQASLLVALVIAAQIGFRKWLNPAWRHALWGLVMARLLLPVLPESPFSVFNVLPQRVEVDLNESVEDPLLEPVSIEPITNAKVIPATEWIATDREGDTNPVNQPELRSVTPLPITVVKPISWPTILRNAWWIGFALASGLMVIAYISMRSRLARFRKIGDKRLLHLLAEAQSIIGIDRQIELLEADGPVGPALFGFFHTRLILPQGLADDFSDDELRNVFLHECGHLRRHDLALNWLVGLLRAAHWFNPVLWWAFARMRTDRELACDDLVLRATGEAKARAYGDTIVRLLEHASKRPLLPGMVGIIESDSDIKQRINRIAGYRKATGWSAVAILLSFTLAQLSLTNAITNTEPPTEEAPRQSLESQLESNRVLLAETWTRITNNWNIHPNLEFAQMTSSLTNVDLVDLHRKIGGLSLSMAFQKVQEGEILMRGKQFEAAQAKFDEAAELSPGFLLVDYHHSQLAQARKQQSRIVSQTNALPRSNEAVPQFDEHTRYLMLIELGKVLYEQGRLDEAETRLEEALHIDPKSEVANHYQGLIRAAKRPKIPSWTTDRELVLPDPFYVTNANWRFIRGDNVGRQRIAQKLDEIVIPQVRFERPTVYEALWGLTTVTRRHEHEGERFAFMLVEDRRNFKTITAPLLDASGKPIAGSGMPMTRLIDQSRLLRRAVVDFQGTLKGRTLRQILDVIVEHLDRPVHFMIEDNAVVLVASEVDKTELTGTANQTTRGGTTFARHGNIFGVKTNTPPTPNPYYLTNASKPFLMHKSDGAQRIHRKLDEIVIPEVYYPGILLEDVMKDLIVLAKRHDPEGQGLNFLIGTRQVPNAPIPQRQVPVLDAMGNAISMPVEGSITYGIENAIINIPQSLTKLKLRHVLDAIVSTSDKPIQYVIEEYAIVFQPKPSIPNPKLFAKKFKVNVKILEEGLQSVVRDSPAILGLTKPVPPAGKSTLDLLRQYLGAAGIDAFSNPNQAKGRSVEFDRTNATILVGASLQELDIVSQALELLGATQQFVKFEVSGAWITPKGTNWPPPSAPGSTFSWITSSEQSKDEELSWSAFPAILRSTNSAAYWVNSFKVRRATLDTKKAVLSDPQYRTILHAIENRDGANVYTSRTKVRQRSLSTIAIPKRGKSSSEIWKRLGLQEGIAVECRAETGDEDDQVRLDVRLVANEASSPVKNEGKDQENFTLKSSIEGAKFPSGNVLMLQFIGSQHSVVVCVRATMLNVDGNPIIRDLKKDTDVWISSRPAELISRWPMTR